MSSVRDWSSQPGFLDPGYKSTAKRGPTLPLVEIPATLSERTGPVYGKRSIAESDADLTRTGVRNGEPIGERILVTGRVLDANGVPVPDTVVEIWQANAAGRYVHSADSHDAPIDPNYLGAGRCVTDAEGCYRFYSIKPGAYPWGNHPNAWRPAHIHLSVFGPSIATRLITQMYFPGDPLLELDPIFASVPAPARGRMVSSFDIGVTEPGFALGYVFDMVLGGRSATPSDPHEA